MRRGAESSHQNLAWFILESLGKPSAHRTLYLLAIVLLAVATRWTLAPRYLYSFDNVNFALAMEDFNPILHQPQPPGYPLFVGLEKVIHFAGPSIEQTQLIAGAIGSIVSLLAIWLLGDELFGSPAGLLSAALLLFNPVFWLAGIGNHIRTFLAAGPLVLALCVWRAWRRDPGRWFLYASLAFAAASGFRPELLLLLFPLWVSGMLRRPIGMPIRIAGCAVLGLSLMPMIMVMSIKAGGWPVLADGFGKYFRMHASDTSIFLGGQPHRALLVALLGIYWTFVGALTWIWAVPMLRIREGIARGREPFVFLLLCFLPPFLFHILIHSDEPDHMLDAIPFVCVAGGWVLSRLRFRVATLALTAASLNALLFFFPLNPEGVEASYRRVRKLGDGVDVAIDSLREPKFAGQTVVLAYRDVVTSHQIAWYFPDDLVLTAASDLALGCPQFSVTVTTRQNYSHPVRLYGNQVTLPVAGRIALLLGPGAPPVLGAAFTRQGPLLIATPVPHEFTLGACRFVAGTPDRK